jgi:hypothetical protein
MVLEDGKDHNGGETKDEHVFIKAGGVIAQAASNLAVLGGLIDNPNTRGDITYALGFSRDGSERRY